MSRAMSPDQDRILILDYGSQYTQLIARSIRELGVYCEIFAPEIDADEINAFGPRGGVLSGDRRCIIVLAPRRKSLPKAIVV